MIELLGIFTLYSFKCKLTPKVSESSYSTKYFSTKTDGNNGIFKQNVKYGSRFYSKWEKVNRLNRKILVGQESFQQD